VSAAGVRARAPARVPRPLAGARARTDPAPDVNPRSHPMCRTLCVVAAVLAAPAAGRADEVDEFIRGEREKMKIPGLTVAVVKDGEVVKAAGYGLANVEHNVPATR